MASQAGVSPTEIVASTVPGPARERPLPLTVTTTLSSAAPVLGSETNTARVPTWFSPAKNSDGLKCTSTVQLMPGVRTTTTTDGQVPKPGEMSSGALNSSCVTATSTELRLVTVTTLDAWPPTGIAPKFTWVGLTVTRTDCAARTDLAEIAPPAIRTRTTQVETSLIVGSGYGCCTPIARCCRSSR